MLIVCFFQSQQIESEKQALNAIQSAWQHGALFWHLSQAQLCSRHRLNLIIRRRLPRYRAAYIQAHLEPIPERGRLSIEADRRALTAGRIDCVPERTEVVVRCVRSINTCPQVVNCSPAGGRIDDARVVVIALGVVGPARRRYPEAGGLVHPRVDLQLVVSRLVVASEIALVAARKEKIGKMRTGRGMVNSRQRSCDRLAGRQHKKIVHGLES